MNVRFLVDGVETPDAKLQPALHGRAWYVHVPDGEPIAYTRPDVDNLLSAVTRTNDIRRYDGDVWLSTDAKPPAQGWPQ